LRAKQKTHAGQHRYAEITPALPAQWFYGCSVISPANQLVATVAYRSSRRACPRHWRDRTTRLDRTRPCRTSCGMTTSIASRPTFGDDRPNAPLAEAGRREIYTISEFRKDKYFCAASLTRRAKQAACFCRFARRVVRQHSQRHKPAICHHRSWPGETGAALHAIDPWPIG
jgi:hypothetical protein